MIYISAILCVTCPHLFEMSHYVLFYIKSITPYDFEMCDIIIVSMLSPRYALIMESPSARHAASIRPCDLMLTGIHLGMRSYGFAVPKDSPLKEHLHKEIIEMVEMGEITRLEDRLVYMDSDDKNIYAWR